ncbi:MAG: hypothetical protein NC131_12805 [Roseburia sp.]|nr:hypothetical protein [Roseburia sp.]
MDLIIGGRKAVIKEGSSFEYVAENRSFSDADDYTLSITLPLAGCPENLSIFGHIGRMDADSRYVVLEASLVDRDFFKSGVVTVVESTDVDVKVQFLEGRSVQNFLTTFDDIYINELQLGSYPSSSLPQYTSTYLSDISHGVSQVALPWVNDSSDGFVNNEMVTDKDGYLVWSDSTAEIGKLSFQPYLIFIAKQICRAIGYSFDLSQWENSPEVYLLVCNTLPASWDIPQYARALPHWSVTEFFEELEKILVCEIDINHRTRQISLNMCANLEMERSVKLDNVVDAFTAESSYRDELCRFKGTANLSYRDRGDSQWQYEDCQWLVDLIRSEGKYILEFDNYLEHARWHFQKFGALGTVTGKDRERGSDWGSLFYMREEDEYGLYKVEYGNLKTYPNMYFYRYMQVNRFGPVVYDPDSDNTIELGFLPARVDTTDDEHGYCLFLSPSGFSEQEDVDSEGIRQPAAYSSLLKGEPDSSAEYYDKILLAYWDGHSANDLTSSYSGAQLPPCPFVDSRFSLKNRYAGYMDGIKVNPREKLKVSWLSSSIPDVRSIFHIRGKRYLCEKITATFTENGMSQLLKGEFYPIV